MAVFSRTEHLARLQEKEFDLLVIGGGIIGAGIARDAAMRGLSVALLEARDFCSGTSSKSSKMLHGGIRYLEQFELSLVFEASRERRLHSDLLAPHLAQPVPFLIPVYPWSPHGMMAVSAGVFLYDMLAMFRNHGTRVLSREKAMQEEARLESKGLKGGVVFHDVVMDDARLGLENVRSAAHHGAVTVNYTFVRGFDKDGTGRIRGVWAKDSLQPEKPDFLVKARAFANASGPWCDYIRRLADPEAEPRLRPTKGAHLVLPTDRLGKTHAFVLTAKADDRVFFSIPWFGRTLVGTTDTDYDPQDDGPLEDIRASQNDVDYLLESVKRTFPGSDVTAQDVHSTFAGLRPLVSEGRPSDPSAVSREHMIWQEESGLFSVAGGKYTTYRTMAAEMVDKVMRHLANIYSGFDPSKKTVTQFEPIVLGPSGKQADQFTTLLEDYNSKLDQETVLHLQKRYGARWQRVADLAMHDSALRERIVASEPDILAEAKYSKDYEMAATFDDFLRRRTMLALKAPLVQNMERVRKAAAIFGENDLKPERILRLQGMEWK
ncbi:MAG TPA: glycerol-3-phosphate dehydrogenase/oxidase [Bdellovibrionota bacterium]|jgi:glycerol-3-phosphate dehydrogenase